MTPHVGQCLPPPVTGRITIPVCQLEFDVGGNTIWVQSPIGATVLRVKVTGKISVDQCQTNPVSHLDLIVDGPARFCLSDDATTID